jgi:hypothetical protein
MNDAADIRARVYAAAISDLRVRQAVFFAARSSLFREKTEKTAIALLRQFDKGVGSAVTSQDSFLLFAETVSKNNDALAWIYRATKLPTFTAQEAKAAVSSAALGGMSEALLEQITMAPSPEAQAEVVQRMAQTTLELPHEDEPLPSDDIADMERDAYLRFPMLMRLFPSICDGLTLCSSTSGVGKTWVCAQVAVALALMGKNVLVLSSEVEAGTYRERVFRCSMAYGGLHVRNAETFDAVQKMVLGGLSNAGDLGGRVLFYTKADHPKHGKYWGWDGVMDYVKRVEERTGPVHGLILDQIDALVFKDSAKDPGDVTSTIASCRDWSRQKHRLLFGVTQNRRMDSSSKGSASSEGISGSMNKVRLADLHIDIQSARVHTDKLTREERAALGFDAHSMRAVIGKMRYPMADPTWVQYEFDRGLVSKDCVQDTPLYQRALRERDLELMYMAIDEYRQDLGGSSVV